MKKYKKEPGEVRRGDLPERENSIEGVIEGFYGSWGSGIATLAIVDGNGLVSHVLCENGPTVRALAAAFGDDVIAPGHTVNQDAIKGKRIRIHMDEMDLLMESFEVL